MSAVTYKSARRGGGDVNRAGHGASPLPPSLCISVKIKSLDHFFVHPKVRKKIERQRSDWKGKNFNLVVCYY
jgi:hypothetical protein